MATTESGPQAEPQAAAPARVESLPWTPQLLRIMAGLMLAAFVAAMDSTVVGTALPTIARELGSFSLYPWIFSGYLLTSTTTVPIWGRLADLHGRKPVLLAGMAIFVGASVLCGASPNMLALILFRSLQGVGAGCLLPVTLTIVGDVFPVAQRARLQGFFSSVWAVAAVVGPLLGAVFVTTVGWRWIFGINLPIGLVAAWMLLGYDERRETGGGRIDPVGALALTAGIALLLWGLGTGSSSAEPNWVAAGGGAAVLALAVVWERRSSSPTVPLHLVTNPVIGPIILAALLAGTVMFGVTAYVPLYVQGGLGRTAYEAGAAVAPLSLGWPIASTLAGRILVRVGYRPLMVVGGLAMMAGALMLALVPWSTPLVGTASGIIGFGLGMLSAPTLIVIQASVPWQLRGAATALNQFSRTIGGAVGVSLMGVLLQARLGVHAAGNPLRAGRQAAEAALQGAIGTVFWVQVVLAAGVLAAAVAIFVARRESALD